MSAAGKTIVNCQMILKCDPSHQNQVYVAVA